MNPLHLSRCIGLQRAYDRARQRHLRPRLEAKNVIEDLRKEVRVVDDIITAILEGLQELKVHWAASIKTIDRKGTTVTIRMTSSTAGYVANTDLNSGLGRQLIVLKKLNVMRIEARG